MNNNFYLNVLLGNTDITFEHNQGKMKKRVLKNSFIINNIQRKN